MNHLLENEIQSSTAGKEACLMKLLIAFVRPEQLDAVQSALKGLDLQALTASEVLDYQEQGSTEIYRGREFRRPASKVRLEIAVADHVAADAVRAIENASDGRRTGGAKVFM